MYAIYETLLPPSAIHHSLYLSHFTPATIYDPPRPSSSRVQLQHEQNVKITGNLVVAGGSDLRVFEISEARVPVPTAAAGDSVGEENGVGGDGSMDAEVGDSFFDTGPLQRAPVAYTTSRRLHLVASHQVHGTITGLAPLRTIESAADGLDRLLVSLKDAKMAILEWSAGDVATVSLHTYERCTQMITGDMSVYLPILRSDPLSRLAVLTLPDDSLAVLPMLQEQSELDPLEAYPRDLPYSPSYVLALSEEFSIKNLRDLVFLPGFHTPTLAMLYSPHHTWAGRYGTTRDTFSLEIRTFDASAGYPLLTSVAQLPSDTLYMLAAPAGLSGVVLVTATGVLHVDQGGRVAAVAANGWWRHVTPRRADERSVHRKLSLEGSRAAFVGQEMLLVLADGATHQVQFEMDGRAVGGITIGEEIAVVPAPTGVCVVGGAVFVGTAEGDARLYNVEMVRDKQDIKPDLELDLDEDDLYADANPVQSSGIDSSGPARIALHPADVLTGTGKITDIEFGIAALDDGTRTYPQLVAISGGTRRSTFNVFRRGIPINKRRRFNELSSADRAWFLPIQRAAGQRLRDIPDDERSTLLLSSEGQQTRVFALANKTNPEQIGRLPMATILAAPFFQRAHVLHVHARGVALLDANGKNGREVYSAPQETPIVAASASDPYVVVRLSDGACVLLEGDAQEKTIVERAIPNSTASLRVQSVEVFTDTTGIYRTFEPTTSEGSPSSPAVPSRHNSSHTKLGLNGVVSTSRTQFTSQQQQQLRHDGPAISAAAPSAADALHVGAGGTMWLALITSAGEVQVRALPDAEVVFRSMGVCAGEAAFADENEGAAGGASGAVGNGIGNGYVARPEGGGGEDMEGLRDEEESDGIRQMLFHPLGKGEDVRPHLFVLHNSGRLNVYAALARFTLSSSLPRRSLAVRFRKVHTQLLPASSAGAAAAHANAQAGGPGLGAAAPPPYTLHPFTQLEGLTGVFVTGEKPQWIVGDETHPVRSYGLKQTAFAFARTTHLGGRGEYFMRIEDGTFICYLPPSLNTDFAIPCDRFEMERVYTNIAFDPPSAHYVGASAISVPFQAYDEEGEILLGPEGETLIPPTNERSTLELFSQGSDPWRVIDGYEFDQNEVVLALQSVTLESESMDGGLRDFIAVGTGFDFAEDRATRGNTYIFEIVQTVGPDPSHPENASWRLVQRTKDPARNPVSALGNMNGYLLNSNGPKIYAKGLDRDERLMGLAFLDINLYATSIRTFKNFALVGDLTKSVWFVSLQETPYKLTAISKDLQEVHTVTADFLVHDGQVAFLSTDRHGNMRMLEFDPADPDSYRGERLMLRTEFHMGAPVTASKTIARRRAPEEEYAPQSQLIYATANGALTSAVAVKPARFKRLQLVAEQLTRNAQHVAGTNPKSHRLVNNDLLAKPLSRGILDGQLLAHFALQPVRRQQEMMRQIGTDEVTVASDLQALGGFW